MFDTDKLISDRVHYQTPVFKRHQEQLMRLISRRPVYRAHYDQWSLTLTLQLSTPVHPTVMPCCFHVLLATGECIIQLGWDILEFAAGQLLLPDALDQMSSALQDAVYIAWIESFVQQVFAVKVLKVAPMQLAAQASILEQGMQPITLLLQGESEGEIDTKSRIALGFELLLPENNLPQFVSWLAKLPSMGGDAHPEIASLTFPVLFILDEFFVSQSVLESLMLGDVVVTAAVQQYYMIQVAQQLQQRGHFMDNQLTLEGAFQEVKPVNSSDALSQQPPQDVFAQLPMRLTFSLCQQELTLAQLRCLQVGQCVPIALQSPSEIVMRVNGQRFAKCEFVQLEEQISLRIIEFISP